MARSELRRLLEDELAALEEPMRELEAAARAFWLHPETASLAVWGQLPVLREIPEPPPGTLSERELYHQLMHNVKPALESRQCGFDTVPVLYPHDRHYPGPAFRTHFLAVVVGAQVRYPAGVTPAEMDGYRAWVDPLIRDVSELGALEDVDVSRSLALRAVLQSYEEMTEIVDGRIPFTHYSPTLPLDFAAEVVGHVRFYELVASEPESASRIIEVCTAKWLEMMRLQEETAAGRWANANYEPGILVSDMILPFLSPASVRQVVIPYSAMLAGAYGGIVANIDHPESSLLDDYLALPGLRGCSVHEGWPSGLTVSALQSEVVLKANYNWHFHRGRDKEAPVCLPWEQCCEQMWQYAGRVRVQASVTGWGRTPGERRECILRDLADLRRIWDS